MQREGNIPFRGADEQRRSTDLGPEQKSTHVLHRLLTTRIGLIWGGGGQGDLQQTYEDPAGRALESQLLAVISEPLNTAKRPSTEKKKRRKKSREEE